MAAWQAAAIALAIGLLIGSERERNGTGAAHPSPVERAGLRTFGLAGLAGGLAALINPVIVAAVVAGAAIIMAAGHLRQEGAVSGTTTEVALALTVVLGGLAVTQPALATAAAVAATVLLIAKNRLHQVVREKISELEMGDALKFFVAAFIVLPLMPHARLGPYGVIDPRRIWTFVVAVTALGWLGYVAVRLLGPRRGLPVAGLAGGFISGAATTGAMARTARSPELRRAALAAALLASVATLIQLVIVVAVADTRVAGLLVPAAALGSAVLVAEAGWLVLRERPTRVLDPDPEPEPAVEAHAGGAPVSVVAIDFGDADPEPAAADTNEPDLPGAIVGRRPFALIPALILAAILTIFVVLAALAEHALGSGGALVAIAAAGAADAHAGALTAASLAAQGTLATTTAVLAAMAAVGANTVLKLVLAYVAGGREVCTQLAALFAGPIVAVVVGLAVTLGLHG